MMMPKPSWFAEEERGNRRAKMGDPLMGLSEHVDFVALAAGIDTASPRPSRAKGGRPPYSTVLMIKILVLQQLYNLADDALEYQLLDRRSFLQFLGLTNSSTIADAKTIWLFRDRLAQAGLGTQLFDEGQQQLLAQGYQARCGQIIDASLVQAPVQRNKREEAQNRQTEHHANDVDGPQAGAKGCRCEVDQKTWQEPFWLQTPCKRRQAIQSDSQSHHHGCRCS
jgi:transposase, IS5 family